MGQSVSRNDQGKGKAVDSFVIGAGAVREGSLCSENGRSILKTKKLSKHTKTTAQSDESANAANRLKQASSWSLGSLSGRLNWSFTGASRSSFRNRNKSPRKSLTSLQQQQDQLRRSKTIWHKPLTNAIFNSHFKELSRNEEFFIEQLIAKGAFGVVFKVIDKRGQDAQSTQTQQPSLAPPPTLPLSPSPSLSPSLSPPSTSPLSPTEVQTTTKTLSKSTRTTGTTKTYALKVLKKSKIIQENSVQQIKDEADIQKICGHHSFIVQQIDLWQNRRNLHILSEFIPNAEIALALDFLHNAGIIYRDAKPENILLTANYHIKLIDFGLSKWLKLGATTKTICGTFQYMAPEILLGEAYGHAVDWWSLGVIVCQMVTNKSPDNRMFLQISLPSNMQNESFALKDHLNSSSRPLSSNQYNGEAAENFLPEEHSSLPHESKDVLHRLLTIDPKQRIRSVMALQKIAMYKNFKIESKHLLNLRPFDIIQRDNISLLNDQECLESSSVLAAKAFHDF